LPFTVSATADMTFLLEIRPKTSFFAPTGETDGGSGQNRVDAGKFCSQKGLAWQPAWKRSTGAKRQFVRTGKPTRGARPALKTKRALAAGAVRMGLLAM